MTYMKFTILVYPSLVIITEFFKRNNAFSLYMTYMATPLRKNPCPRGHEIYMFGRPCLGHYYCILRFSDLCLGVEKKIFKEIKHFHYMTYMATPQHKSPCPSGHEIYNFGRPSLIIITTNLVCLIYAWEQRRRFLKK